MESILHSIPSEHQDFFFSEIVRHHLHPLILKNLKNNNLLHCIPRNIHPIINKHVIDTIAYTSFLLDLAQKILRAARDKNILLIPLKGAHFIPLYYAPEERPMRDIDLLIHRNDIQAVKNLLESLGLKIHQGNLSTSFLMRFGGELKFETKNSEMPALVETQWNIAEAPYLKRAFAFDPEWLIKSSEETHALSPEAALVFSVFHLAISHSFSRLIWLLDIHKIITNENLQWDIVLNAVEKFKMKKVFRITLDLCREFFNTPIPDDVSPTYLCRHPVVKKIILSSLSGNKRIAESGIIQFLVCEHRAAFLFSFLFPGTEFVSLRYSLSPRTAFFYSLIRPFKLLPFGR
ncbi:MAG: nucleotidyltransferase family protein [bacterium]